MSNNSRDGNITASLPLSSKPRSKVVALMSVFNAQDLIERSIEALLPAVDEIRVFDGRFEGANCYCGKEHPNSCDKTKEKVAGMRRLGRIQFIELGLMQEQAKRNRMFDGLLEGEWALVVDDDEIFFGNPAALYACDGINAAYVNLLLWRASFDPFPRFFKKTPGLRYDDWLTLSDDNGLICDFRKERQFKRFTHPILPGMGLVALAGAGTGTGYRSLERQKVQQDYNARNIKQSFAGEPKGGAYSLRRYLQGVSP